MGALGVGVPPFWKKECDVLVRRVNAKKTENSVSQGSSFGAVESVKSTSDINSPISEEIVEVNTKLTETPALVHINMDG
ncbi:hypothetical protein RND71_015951 [Anisodus tanguticus]|uniref:Uncharacterized protein n=1 Tax=Anisodus tanguticus TaxID=243964 RepID=A0AAE1S8F3_9SOLA|nr:hypothetical protein RND71_015951 [Anisodus tanguticus]